MSSLSSQAHFAVGLLCSCQTTQLEWLTSRDSGGQSRAVPSNRPQRETRHFFQTHWTRRCCPLLQSSNQPISRSRHCCLSLASTTFSIAVVNEEVPFVFLCFEMCVVKKKEKTPESVLSSSLIRGR